MLLAKLLLACLTLTSLEEKVGQLLITSFEGKEVGADAKRLIAGCHIGGVILYRLPNGLEDPSQIEQLCSGLQSCAEVPLLIGVDQEGGSVARLQEGFTIVPSAQELGERGDPEIVYAFAKRVGEEMQSVGLSINFAPVVDVADGQGVAIGNRSFGRDPEKVAQLGGAFAQGLSDGGVIPCLKHFVGYGSANLDAHNALPSAPFSEEALLPYRRLTRQVPAIMTAHLRLPNLDPRACVTLSEAIITGLLREGLGFDGVIITDSLTMQGVLEEAGSLEEAAIRAVEAGCDLLLIGGRSLDGEAWYPLRNAERIYHALLGAIRSGRLTEERIDQSVDRILLLKSTHT